MRAELAEMWAQRANSLEATDNYVEALLLQGSYAAAVPHARRLVQLSKDTPHMARSEGFLAMALTRLRAAQAAEYITKLTQYRNNPHAVSALAEIAGTLVDQGNLQRAVALYARVDEEIGLLPTPYAFSVSLQHAKALRKCGRDAAAVAVLEPVVPGMARELGDKDESTLVASLELALARSEAGLAQGLSEVRRAVGRMVRDLTKSNMALRAMGELAYALYKTGELPNMKEAAELMKPVVAGLTARGNNEETLRSEVHLGMALASVAEREGNARDLKRAKDNLRDVARRCAMHLGEENETTMLAQNAAGESNRRKNAAFMTVGAPVIYDGQRGEIVGVSGYDRDVRVGDEIVSAEASELSIACYNPRCETPDRKATNRCSGCNTAQYCCRECQKADWPRHRPECKALQEKVGH
jgi:tetratricopeptide (TPR) repeat protein